MMRDQFPHHFFHAFGYGFGARFTEPFCDTLDTQGATCIPVTGGHSTATSSKINFHDVIRIDQATTQIGAIEEKGSFDCVVTSSVENINILNQVTADRIVSHVAVKTDRKRRPKKDNQFELEPNVIWFQTIGSRFENLRVGGVHIKVDIEDEVGYNYGGSKPVSKNPVFDVNDPGKGPINVEFDDAAVLTTLARGVHPESNRVKVYGNAIVVPDFGVVYLAEYLVTEYARYLNMLRVELGCGFAGRGSGPGSGGNGQTIPPPV
jgi:hypothetical protein